MKPEFRDPPEYAGSRVMPHGQRKCLDNPGTWVKVSKWATRPKWALTAEFELVSTTIGTDDERGTYVRWIGPAGEYA